MQLLWAWLASDCGLWCLFGIWHLSIVCGLGCTFSMFSFVLFLNALAQWFFWLHAKPTIPHAGHLSLIWRYVPSHHLHLVSRLIASIKVLMQSNVIPLWSCMYASWVMWCIKTSCTLHMFIASCSDNVLSYELFLLLKMFHSNYNLFVSFSSQNLYFFPCKCHLARKSSIFSKFF